MSDGNWAWCFACASLSELEDTGQISLKSRSSRCRFIKLDRQKLTRKRKGLTQKRTSYSSLAAHCLLWHPVQFVSVQVKQDMLNPTDCFRTNTHNQTSINTYPHTLPQNTMTHFQKNQHDWPHPSVSVSAFHISSVATVALTVWERNLKWWMEDSSVRNFAIKIRLTACMTCHQRCDAGNLPDKRKKGRLWLLCTDGLQYVSLDHYSS